ncbi:uncharacterized protein TNCV_45971 [Trichonephila clavipes]|nr:uncharacterized protein TNCV_45971 [Trichonephila clavipes]
MAHIVQITCGMFEGEIKSMSKTSTRGLLATDHAILNHGQVTWTTPELAPPLQTTTPHQREDVSALDRFNVHRCPTRRVFSATGLELVTRQATIRYLYHSATAAPKRPKYGTKTTNRHVLTGRLIGADGWDIKRGGGTELMGRCEMSGGKSYKGMHSCCFSKSSRNAFLLFTYVGDIANDP